MGACICISLKRFKPSLKHTLWLDNRIFDIGFALSKCPHLQRAYLVRVPYSFSITVYLWEKIGMYPKLENSLLQSNLAIDGSKLFRKIRADRIWAKSLDPFLDIPFSLGFFWMERRHMFPRLKGRIGNLLVIFSGLFLNSYMD